MSAARSHRQDHERNRGFLSRDGSKTLIANVLTVVFVYCFAVIGQQERSGDEGGRLTYLWLIVMVFMFMLYGLYTWGVHPLDKPKRSATPADSTLRYVGPHSKCVA